MGLRAGEALTLTNAANAEDLRVDANGLFSFSKPVTAGASYAVSLKNPPPNSACQLAHDQGTASANVEDMVVVCTPTDGSGDAVQAATYGNNSLLLMRSIAIDSNDALAVSPASVVFKSYVFGGAIADPLGRFVLVALNDYTHFPAMGTVLQPVALGATGASVLGSPTTPRNDDGGAVNQLVMDPLGRWVYIQFSSGATRRYGIEVANGQVTFTELPVPGQPSAIPQIALVDPLGRGYYGYDGSNRTLYRYPIDRSGQIAQAPQTLAVPVPQDFLFDPLGRYLFLVTGSSIATYAMDTSGLLSANSSISTALIPTRSSVVIDPLGRFVYVLTSAYQLLKYTVDSADGHLTQVSSTDLAGELNAICIECLNAKAGVPSMSMAASAKHLLVTVTLSNGGSTRLFSIGLNPAHVGPNVLSFDASSTISFAK
jgi:hypothetical protein